jgi:hypothetical protein
MESHKDQFNVYINGISDVCENSNTFLYADDTEIHSSSKDIGIVERCVNEDLTQVDDWLSRNGLVDHLRNRLNFDLDKNFITA